jgi:hypothetical protein
MEKTVKCPSKKLIMPSSMIILGKEVFLNEAFLFKQLYLASWYYLGSALLNAVPYITISVLMVYNLKTICNRCHFQCAEYWHHQWQSRHDIWFNQSYWFSIYFCFHYLAQYRNFLIPILTKMLKLFTKISSTRSSSFPQDSPVCWGEWKLISRTVTLIKGSLFE